VVAIAVAGVLWRPQASERVFVPLTVGGGIKGFRDASGHEYSALEVASEYFR
jgi:imidazole glycerol-phosphate synthase